MRLMFLFLLSSVVLFAQYDTLKTTYPDGTVKELFPRYQKRLEGTARFYYETGMLREERNYQAGKVDGLVKQYDSLGKLSITFTIESGKREGPCTYFSPDGSLLKEIFYVNGQIEIPDTTGIPADEIEQAAQIQAPPAAIENGNTIAKERPVLAPALAPQDTIAQLLARDTLFIDKTIPENPVLARLSIIPSPRIGWQALQEKVVFPKYAIEKGISGKVRMRVIVNTSGDVVRNEVVQGLGYGCDDAALIAVYYTRFFAAEVNGKRKTCELVFDIDFRKPVK
ncbi:MAG: TonB family protein [Ignavibacteriales bacterium]|nr:TonB family protein [Ignavibacteriales bacterium]